MRIFRTARLPLFGVTLAVLAACGSVEEQCRSQYGASETAYDQCVERQYRAIEDMQRHTTQSLPDT